MSKTFNANQLRAYREDCEYIAILNHISLQLEMIGDEIVCDFDDNMSLEENIFKKSIPAIEDTIKILKQYRSHAFNNSDNDKVFFNGEHGK